MTLFIGIIATSVSLALCTCALFILLVQYAYAIAHAIFKHYFFLLLFGPPTAPLASYLGLL